MFAARFGYVACAETVGYFSDGSYLLDNGEVYVTGSVRNRPAEQSEEMLDEIILWAVSDGGAAFDENGNPLPLDIPGLATAFEKSVTEVLDRLEAAGYCEATDAARTAETAKQIAADRRASL